MKKLISACASIVTAIFTFIFLSTSCFEHTSSLTNTKFTGWQILSDENFVNIFSKVDGYSVCKVFIIIAIVLACLLLVTGIITLLQQFNVFKTKINFCLINSILLAIFTISSLVAMIGAVVMGNNLTVEALKSIYEVDMGLIFMLIIGVVATVLSFVSSFSKKKRK